MWSPIRLSSMYRKLTGRPANSSTGLSTSAMRVGRSPYTLFVDMKTNAASGTSGVPLPQGAASSLRSPRNPRTEEQRHDGGTLGCGMDNQVRPQLLDQRRHLLLVACVEGGMSVAWNFALQRRRRPTGIALRPEEDGAMLDQQDKPEDCPAPADPGQYRNWPARETGSFTGTLTISRVFAEFLRRICGPHSTQSRPPVSGS